jgi:hypothetical protein
MISHVHSVEIIESIDDFLNGAQPVTVRPCHHCDDENRMVVHWPGQPEPMRAVCPYCKGLGILKV